MRSVLGRRRARGSIFRRYARFRISRRARANASPLALPLERISMERIPAAPPYWSRESIAPSQYLSA